MFATKAKRGHCARRQRGASLITAVFLLVGLAALGALMTKLTIFGTSKSVKSHNAMQALAAAESAVTAAAYDIVHNDDCTGPWNGSAGVGSNSTAAYSATCAQTGQGGNTINLYRITATGTAGSGDYQAKRVLIVQFTP